MHRKVAKEVRVLASWKLNWFRNWFTYFIWFLDFNNRVLAHVMNFRDLLRWKSTISNRLLINLLNILDLTMKRRLIIINWVMNIQVYVLFINRDKLLLLRNQHQVSLNIMILYNKFWMVIWMSRWDLSFKFFFCLNLLVQSSISL